MEPFRLPANELPAVIPSGSGNDDGAAARCWSVCGEKRLRVSGKDVDSVSARLASCPAPREAVEGGGPFRPASSPLLTRQRPLTPEEVVWTAVCEEMRYYLSPGNCHGATDEAPKPGCLKLVERVCLVGKGKCLYCPAAVFADFWEYAREREQNGDEETCKMYV